MLNVYLILFWQAKAAVRGDAILPFKGYMWLWHEALRSLQQGSPWSSPLTFYLSLHLPQDPCQASLSRSSAIIHSPINVMKKPQAPNAPNHNLWPPNLLLPLCCFPKKPTQTCSPRSQSTSTPPR